MPIEFNMIVESLPRKQFRIIMPDAYGSIDDIPLPKTGSIVKWPTNPHFTGKRMIERILTSQGPYLGWTPK